jgi:hypothetical protein
MSKEGAELGVELAEMWLCGRSYLPAAAEATAEANAIVAGSASGDGAFSRPGTLPGAMSMPGTVQGDVFPHWDALRDALQGILAEAAENLYACGDALVRVADIYAATDQAAAAEMRRVTTRFEGSAEFRIDDPSARPPLQRPA